MNITHTCLVCGEALELTHDQAVYPDTVAISVPPCPKCLKDQAVEMLEEISEYWVDNIGLQESEFGKIIIDNCIDIIKEKAGIE